MRDLLNWAPIKDPNYLIQAIYSIDDSRDNWVKWKNYANQVVVQTNDYFYKVYNDDLKFGLFLLKIRTELTNIYNSWGIHWQIHSQITDQILTIEQRQKLQVPTMPFNSLFSLWRNTLNELEKRLKFNNIKVQLKEYIPQLQSIHLVRDCVNKNDDYAVLNNHCVLLDDAEFFLAFVDSSNNWISLPFNIYTVFIDSQEKIIAPYNLFDVDPIANCTTTVNRWWIFDNCYTTDHIAKQLIDKREQMLNSNIRYLCGLDEVLYTQVDHERLR